jgi:hypothetical protein
MGVRRGNLLTAGLVVALVITGLWIRAVAQGPPIVGTIVLADVNGTCQKTLIGNDSDPNFKSRINHAKKDQNVRWLVVNNTCQSRIAVELKDWSPSSPFGTATLNCSASNGTGTCNITARVLKTANSGTYSYVVYVGNTPTKDPDLIIDP